MPCQSEPWEDQTVLMACCWLDYCDCANSLVGVAWLLQPASMAAFHANKVVHALHYAQRALKCSIPSHFIHIIILHATAHKHHLHQLHGKTITTITFQVQDATGPTQQLTSSKPSSTELAEGGEADCEAAASAAPPASVLVAHDPAPGASAASGPAWVTSAPARLLQPAPSPVSVPLLVSGFSITWVACASLKLSQCKPTADHWLNHCWEVDRGGANSCANRDTKPSTVL